MSILGGEFAESEPIITFFLSILGGKSSESEVFIRYSVNTWWRVLKIRSFNNIFGPYLVESSQNQKILLGHLSILGGES